MTLFDWVNMYRLCSITLLLLNISSCSAFAPIARHQPALVDGLTTTANTETTRLFAHNKEESGPLKSIQEKVNGVIAATLVTGSLWALPSMFVGSSITATSNPLWNDIQSTMVVNAKEMASGSGSRVNKDPESLLRYGLPIPKDKEIRKFQTTIEEIRQDIASKRKGPAIDGVNKTEKQLSSKASTFTGMCRDASKCSTIVTKMQDTFAPLNDALKSAQDNFTGSEQERSALDKAYAKHDELQKLLSQLEEQMVPAGYETPVPSDYSDLPQLKGRATVEFVIKKQGNAPFQVESKFYPQAKMVMIIDGFTAPVTGGNFVELVEKGFYNNMKISRSDGFVVQTGDPEGEADGYVATPSKSVGAGKHGERLIPSEIFVKGDKGPFYETTIEDEGRGGQATVLPFSSYGAMGWAREEYDANSGSSQFFWLLFDSDLTPAGKNVIDGSYPCFGYIVEGADFLRDTSEGDIITSAKVIDGKDLLVLPAVAPAVAQET